MPLAPLTLVTAAVVAIVAAMSARREFSAPFAPALLIVGCIIAALSAGPALFGVQLNEAVYVGCLVLVCAQICETDRRTLIIPDALVLLLVFLAAVAPFAPDRLSQILGAALAGGLFLAVRQAFYLWKGAHGLGLGDVKLAAAIGALLGPAPALTAVAIAAAVTALVLVLSRGLRGAEVPRMAPFGIGLSAALALTVVLQARP